MAAEVVLAAGGAALGAVLNVLLDRMASERFVDFFRRQKLSDRLLKKLTTAMNSVRGVLDDAEEKEITKPAVKQWLDDLKNAFFEADDLLDEIDLAATRLELEAESRSAIDEVRKFLRPRKSFKKGLTEMLETIEDLVNQKDTLGLRDIIGGGESTQRTPTTSLVERSNIFGRERDQEAIMEVLLSDDVNRSNNLSIISIVGLGGMGKTTLAQLIYRDERVQNRFDVRGWVCASDVFDVPKITRDIAMEVAQMACDDKTLNQIQVDLKEKLTGKRLLLVLDDVWNEKFNYWEQLLTPLKSGGPGSTIIITTRHDVVATNAPSSSIFRLSKLDSTDCWQLFCKYAFDDQNPQDYPHLERIGQEIVKKCDGLPLAVRVMGGVLRIERNVKDWENVLRNDLWEVSEDGILPVLRLSYRHLPPHLKQCFAYCSIFPKDHKFEKEQLILLWMAEGFLIEKGNKTMEERGEEYFKQLVSRSFFQHVNNSFVMHDLINDLARVVAGDFCFRFENQDSCRTFDKLRYFSCVAVKEESSSRQLSSIFKSRRLRTFLPLSRCQKLVEMIHDLFLNQQRLRVLSLSGCSNVKKLPSSISHLKHLRYLDLSWTSIVSLPQCLCSFYNLQTLKLSSCVNLVKLPSSISHLEHLRYLDLSRTSIKSLPECLCSFYNLQTLKLYWCWRLTKLPTKMGRLINMRYLDIESTNLQEMPPNMGKLIKLQTLTDFFVGTREGCGVKELGSLQHLGGTLRIHNLQNVVNAKDVLEAKIKCKKNLKELWLYWVGDTDNPRHEEAVLDGLEPHTETEIISIIGYGGTSFPNWLGDSSFTKLVKLKLVGCKSCSSLPPIGQMSSLKYLEVSDFNEVREIDYGFYGTGRCVSAVKPFQSLEIIRFYNMPQWQEWRPYGREGESESGPFPCLKEIRVKNCPNLKGTLPIHLPSLTKLVIQNCPQLQNCVPNAPNLSSILLISNYGGPYNDDSSNSLAILNFQESVLEKIGQLGCSFEDMKIVEHEPLQCFPLELLPKSKCLRIEECPHFEYFRSPTQEFVPFKFLTELIIEDCPKLKSLPERMHSLLHALLKLKIIRCPVIETFPRDGLPLKLQSLAIGNCKKLIVGRMNWDLQKLTSLTSFSIKDYEAEEMECFPAVILLPSVLTSLEICNMPYLKSLKCGGLEHFGSLEKLIIKKCCRLQLVPDEGLPSTLTYLEFCDFQNLDFLFNSRFRDLTSLRILHIKHCPEIASLPEEGLPPSLTTLILDNLQNLRSVEGLRHLTSLKSLSIRDCPRLKTLPEEVLPPSFSGLHVWCPLLVKRYRGKGVGPNNETLIHRKRATSVD